MKRRIYVLAFVCLFVTLFTIPHTALAQSQANVIDPYNDLAQRFRPFLKYTHDNGEDEMISPCTWQWFIARSQVLDQYTNVVWDGSAHQNDPISVLDVPGADVRTSVNDQGLWLYLKYLDEPDYASGMGLHPNDNNGNNITTGAGIYAHVEPINDDLINIEYIILYPYNRGYNNNFCEIPADLGIEGGDHSGDMTILTVVYSKNCDQLIRATFTPHGKVILSYDLSYSQNTYPCILNGDNGSVAAMAVTPTHYYEDGPDDFYDGGGCTRTVYFVPDPKTGRYEHIAAFVEWGTHELYPSSCGNVLCMPSHDGNGPSFLPAQVTYLGRLPDMLNANSSYYENAPFVFFNGNWGSDPQGPMMHMTWYRENYDNSASQIVRWNGGDFSDRDPYVSYTNMSWPPFLLYGCNWELCGILQATSTGTIVPYNYLYRSTTLFSVLRDYSNPSAPISGNFKYTYRAANSLFYFLATDFTDMEVMEGVYTAPNAVQIWGHGMVNGVSGYRFTATVQDNARPPALGESYWDMFGLSVFDSQGNYVWYLPASIIAGGDIQLER
jgi:hypothetical protein